MNNLFKVFALLFLFISGQSFSQKTNSQEDIAILWKNYGNAIEFNDLIAAKNILYQSSSLSSENKGIYDILLNLCLEIGTYVQTVLAINISVPGSSHEEIKAYLSRKLSENKIATDIFDELFLRNYVHETGYQQGSLYCV